MQPRTRPRIEPGRTPRVLIFIECEAIRGAAKSVLTFLGGVRARVSDNDGPIAFSVATFRRLSRSGEGEPELAKAVRELGCDIHVIDERTAWDCRVLPQVARVVNAVGPDVIHTNNVKSHFIVKALGLYRRQKWIASHHGYTTTDFKMRCYNHFDRWSLRSANRVVIPCQAFRNQLRGCGIPSARFTVLPNSGVTLRRCPEDELFALRTRLALRSDERVIVSIGRLSEEKGQADLIKAFRIVRERLPDVACKLLLVGSGPELTRLQTEAVSLRVESKVLFLPSEPDVTPILNIADVFALPSHSDGSPHVIFEAIGAGVPIVATDVGGVPEMLTDNETAALVKARKPESIATGLVRLLADSRHAESLATSAAALLTSRYSPAQYVSGLYRVYEETIGGN